VENLGLRGKENERFDGRFNLKLDMVEEKIRKLEDKLEENIQT
jgi:hypothetical protein